MTVRWHVLRSKANKEMSVWRELVTRGFECFYPQLHLRAANPRSRKMRAYFPGYLLVQTDMEQVGISTFQWMPFSSSFIAFDGVPATVTDHLIQAIRRHMDQINETGGKHLAGLKKRELV